MRIRTMITIRKHVSLNFDDFLNHSLKLSFANSIFTFFSSSIRLNICAGEESCALQLMMTKRIFLDI